MSPIVHDALLLFAHFVCIITLACLLTGEVILFRKTLPADMVRRMQLIDRWYGIVFLFVLLTGLSLLFFGSKGVLFFTHNPVFWTKMGLIVAIALLSIYPTIAYLRWDRRKQPDGSIVLEDAEYGRILVFLWAQVCLFVFIPLCATLMAGGI
jgi:putative membrane protein